MTTHTITSGIDQTGQKFQLAHDGQLALMYSYEGNRWNYMSRATIRSLTKLAHQMGIKWDKPDKIRELYNYRVATKPDRVRKALERDKKYAPYRIAQMGQDD